MEQQCSSCVVVGSRVMISLNGVDIRFERRVFNSCSSHERIREFNARENI